MNYIKLIFDLKTPDEADLITAFLSGLNVQGYEQTDHTLFAFFDEATFDEANVLDILRPLDYWYQKELIPHENWNAQWESNFEPIRINEEVGVRANFHPPFVDCQYDIVITPKMSFGTGHHETTQMMLTYECETDFAGKSVLDFGCGTGVLAIFASLKGAKDVIGIDNDEWSIENARENCRKNGCDTVEISDQAIQTMERSFDIILANINLNVLLESLSVMKKMLTKGGHIFLSGILYTDLPSLSERIASLGFTLHSQKRIKDWVALDIN